jgi:hypothetical protein
MPRNGSGTYSIPNTFSPGTTISSPATNANNSDIGAELTNSLSRDGQSSMTGQFKGASGTEALPGIAWSSDTDTGFRRSTGDTMMAVTGGDDLMELGPAGVNIQSGKTLSLGGVAVESFAAGTAMLFIQTSAPTGWTKQTGTDNAGLRLVSGTASSGGTANFTDAFTSRTIAQANLPNVNLTAASDGAHTHTFTYGVNSIAGSPAVQFVTTIAQTGQSQNVNTQSNGAHTHNVPLGGSGTAMDFAVKYKDVIHATKD